MPFGARRRPRDGIHTVAEGETISSIGATYGFTDWEERIWNAGENAELKAARINPNTLVRGDNVFIPELEEKQESRPTDAWHDFHVIRNKRFLRLKLQDENGKPLENKRYEITAEPTFRGTFVQQGQTTDAEGKIEEEIPHTLTKAKLELPDEHLRVNLQIGYLQPLPMDEPIKIVAGGEDVLGRMNEAGTKGDDLLGGAGDEVGGVWGSIKQAAQDLYEELAPAVSAAAPLVNAIAGMLGEDDLLDVSDASIFAAAQRLESLGYDPGHPQEKADPKFTAALMTFQTWAKQNGALEQGAGGLLGGLGGVGVGGAIAGALLSKVGMTGNLDKETIEALKKVHGC